jgi:hypothetical protein
MRLFEATLHEYPDDPNALNGLGCLISEAGDFESGETMLRRALEINPAAAVYRMSFAAYLERIGNIAAAREQAWAATADPAVREGAQRLLARLGGPPPRSKDTLVRASQSGVEPSRMAPCPCGSGKRYKHCCGQMARAAVFESADDSAARRAAAAFQAGEADLALEMLVAVLPERLVRAETALACADCCQQAEVLGEKVRLGEFLVGLCDHWYRVERRDSMRRALLEQIGRFKARQAASFEPLSSKHKHIIGAFGKIGGSAHRAFGLYETLSHHTSVRLWSTVLPTPEYAQRYPITMIDLAQGEFPRSGHLIFVGTYFDYGDWLSQSWPGRITITLNIDLLDTLITRLVQLEEVPSAFVLDLSYPSRYFRNLTGLPGTVEYAIINTERFCPVCDKMSQNGAITIGRLSRDDRMKFHPNDPAFFRQLAKESYRVRIFGGAILEKAYERNARDARIALLPEGRGDITEFLASLDCFFYRTHPHWIETGGTVVALCPFVWKLTSANMNGAA